MVGSPSKKEARLTELLANKCKYCGHSIYTVCLFYDLLQYIDMGQPGEAISALSTAISQKPEHTDAWTNLGLLYEDLSQLIHDIDLHVCVCVCVRACVCVCVCTCAVCMGVTLSDRVRQVW